ncbi:MAG TPA: 4Fe-4S cluster-binding domain-containing protein, partial [bacterium]|nr:4Fe-4S cluster-binding domain-containing protein [bacterium]
MDNDNLLIDNSYKIKEYIINSEWDKTFPCEYFEYRKQWDMANQGILLDKPLFLEIESTYACNYRCKMCPRRESDNFSDKLKLPDDLFDILFQQIKEYKIPSATFSHGGEPLMRKDLPELIL